MQQKYGYDIRSGCDILFLILEKYCTAERIFHESESIENS